MQFFNKSEILINGILLQLQSCYPYQDDHICSYLTIHLVA